MTDDTQDIVERLRRSPNMTLPMGAMWTMAEQAADLIEAQAAEIERLRGMMALEREENLWNAYNIGHERDGEWTHCFMSDGEWLIREIGLDQKVGHYDAKEVRRLIPQAAGRAVLNEKARPD